MSYVYKAASLRDPFAPLFSSAGTLAGGPAASTARPEGPAQKSIEEVESGFNPENLILKAILTDKSRGLPIALVSNPANPDEEYVVKGAKIRHAGSGLTLKSFSAAVGRDHVLIKKTEGEPLISVVNFPKEEGKP